MNFPSHFSFWFLGIRKNHRRAQWNVGRETAKDRGDPHGEVSISGPCLVFSVSVTHGWEIWVPSLQVVTQFVCVLSVWDNPLKLHLSFFFYPFCTVCLTHFTCPSHFPCTHSVSFRYLLSRHTRLHKPPSDTLSPPYTQSFVAADVSCVTVCQLSVTGANHRCHIVDHLL